MKDLEPGTVVCPECGEYGAGLFHAEQPENDHMFLQCQCGAKFRPIMDGFDGKPLLSAVYKWNHTDYNWNEAEYINGYWAVPRVLGYRFC